jgi:sRNA-binding regulator protein Hfq
MEQQRRFERRDTLRPRPGFERSDKKPKGHDAVLKALQDSGRQCTVVTLSGETFFGKVIGRDKFTITLLVTASPTDIGPELIRRVFYKHALEQFYGEEAPTPQAS